MRESIPVEVRSMVWTRTIRYIGWGFAESLIPIFIMSLAGSYAAAGLFQAAYQVTYLLALPLIGLLAERYSAKWLVVMGLILYPFVGISYYLAGLTGIALYLVIARAINGVTWSIDSTGIDTYIRRLTPTASISKSFGYLDTFPNLAWMLAALCGIWLIKHFPVYELLILIGPFALLALPFALNAKNDHPVLGKPRRTLPIRAAYRTALEEWRAWGTDLRFLALLFLFTEAVTVLIGFFIPIDIYQKSLNPALVIVFTVVSTIPALFGYWLGAAADHHSKPRLAALSCGAMGLILLGLSLPLSYTLIVCAGLLLGILLELLSILQKSIATELVSAEHFGRLDSTFGVVYGISALATPPLIGAALDLMSFSTLAAILAAIALFLTFAFVLKTHPMRAKPQIEIPLPEHAV